MNSGRNEICWDIDVANVSTVILAHVHEARAGSNGPVRIDFNGKLEGCRSVDRELLRDVRASPADYYVNVHTDQFKVGAVRGQLSK